NLLHQGGEKVSGGEGRRRGRLRSTDLGWFGDRGRALREFFPEELAAIEDFAATQVKDIHGQHVIFKVVAEDFLVVAFGRGHALLFLELRDGGNHVTIAGGALIFLLRRGFFHSRTERLG